MADKFVFKIAWQHNSVAAEKVFEFEAANFYMFRHEVLKKFSNTHFLSKLEAQKEKVKELCYIATSIKQMLGVVNVNTDFNFSLVSYNGKAMK